MTGSFDWFLRGFLKDATGVLDLGCGTMRNALLAPRKADYIGIDVALLPKEDWPRLLKHPTHRSGKTVRMVAELPSSLEALAGMPISHIIMTDFIEHMHQDEGLLQIATLLRHWPAARMAIYTPLGFLAQDHGADHPMTHRSGWRPSDFDPEQWKLTESRGDQNVSFWAWR